MVTLLLDNGADINHTNHSGENALLIACYETNRMLAKLLIERGSDVFTSSNNGYSPIWYACASNQKEIVALFLENGVDVNYSKPVANDTSSMNDYLDWIVSATNISNESSFTLNNSYTYGGESLLHVATKKGNLSMVKLLIEGGANINIQDESGNTPLHYSAANGKKDVVKYLLDNKADASIVNVKEQKAIDYSNVKGFNEITELILKYAPSGTTVNPINTVPQTEAPKADTSNSMETKKKALLDLKELLDAGILTSEEFDIEKSKILKG